MVIGRPAVRYFGKSNMDGGIRFWVFPNIDTLEIYDILKKLGYRPYGRRCSHTHDCCGCFLLEEITIRRGKFRTLVKQRYGWNV